MPAKDSASAFNPTLATGESGCAVELGGPGRRLLELLQGLRPEGYENSFKMSAAALLADRFLFGMRKPEVSPARLYALCAGIGMPDPYLRELAEGAQTANAFHFGFEGTDGGGLYKVYLEYAGRLRPGSRTPALLHLAYKWDCLDPARRTIARYVCHPGLSAEAILDRLDGGGAPEGDVAALDTMKDIVRLAARRTVLPLMYLEVSEEKNPRASFDIKLHDAALRLADIAEHLRRLRLHYALPEAQFEALYARIRNARLGHLSGGLSRDGKRFVTVYYAPEGR